MIVAIAERRLRNQLVTRAGLRRAGDVVQWLGAVQAQEYEPAKWALGLRMKEGTVDADIERAFEKGEILRTHVMRPTWHFVTPQDIRWMLELTAPRVHRILATYIRNVGLDAKALARGTAVIERALDRRQFLTRRELAEFLRQAGMALAGLRLAFLMIYAELEGVICSGPRRGTQFSYALLAQRAPKALRLSRDEAIATLCRRYFTSHGPATIRDFVWWSGLTTADAKRGLDMTRARHEDVDGRTYWTIGRGSRAGVRAGIRPREHLVHLLPIYDEYLVAYRDREAVPHGPSVVAAGRRVGVNFRHALVIGGQVAGTWRTTRAPRAVRMTAVPLRRLTGPERLALRDAAGRYQRFLGAAVELAAG